MSGVTIETGNGELQPKELTELQSLELGDSAVAAKSLIPPHEYNSDTDAPKSCMGTTAEEKYEQQHYTQKEIDDCARQTKRVQELLRNAIKEYGAIRPLEK